MTKAELLYELNGAHALLDRLGIERGDEYGAWTLAFRIEKLADATAAVRREAQRLLNGEK